MTIKSLEKQTPSYTENWKISDVALQRVGWGSTKYSVTSAEMNCYSYEKKKYSTLYTKGLNVERQTLKLLGGKYDNSIWPYYILNPLINERYHKLSKKWGL